MSNLRDRPIKQKLMLIVMLTTTVAMLLSAGGIIAFDSFLFRRNLQRDQTALAQIIADNSTASLSFNDPRTAAETLAALRARPHVESACIYRLDGSLLANYARPGVSSVCAAGGERNGFQFKKDDVTVAHAIVLSGRRIGTLILIYDLDEIAERTQVYGATVFGVLLISGLLAFLLSSKLRATIADPISQLVRATTSVSETGDYAIRAQKLSSDELGVLVDGFNAMLAGIQLRDSNLQTALRDREEAFRQFRFMAESMPQKIFTAAPNGEIDYLNQQWTEFTGLTFKQIKGGGWTQFVHPEDVGENLRIWRASIESGEPFYFQHRFRRADGAYRWHLSRAQPMRDAHGSITMWIGSNTDIHEQKEKEEELRRANDDLQQFAYSASHDLQEPIRNVAVYSEIVAKRYHSVLDADGQQFLGFLMEGGRRLATLIDDLLAYTRAGVMENADVAPVDSSEVLQNALGSLSEAIRESGATVTHDPLPAVCMSEAHLLQVFQNLISNAVKYRQEAEAPRIHVAVERVESNWRFSVQDNGIGIDPQYKEIIFGVFKRLHRDSKYTGTGIGLAICHRVVELYGGRIWVESKSGEGATFFFTVPEPASRAQAASTDTAAR